MGSILDVEEIIPGSFYMRDCPCGSRPAGLYQGNPKTCSGPQNSLVS
jgi:hypothetical protein